MYSAQSIIIPRRQSGQANKCCGDSTYVRKANHFRDGALLPLAIASSNGEQKAKCYALSVKSCRVWFRDRQGIEHGVYVQAVCRFHAFGLALRQLRRCSWSNPDHSGVQQMTVEVLEKWSSQQRIAVTKDDFDTWLGKKQENLHQDRARKYLRMLLGLDPQDRDFGGE